MKLDLIANTMLVDDIFMFVTISINVEIYAYAS